MTDEDPAAAFPQLDEPGDTVHDQAIHYYVLFDQLEFQAGDGLSSGSSPNRSKTPDQMRTFRDRPTLRD